VESRESPGLPGTEDRAEGQEPPVSSSIRLYYTKDESAGIRSRAYAALKARHDPAHALPDSYAKCAALAGCGAAGGATGGAADGASVGMRREGAGAEAGHVRAALVLGWNWPTSGPKVTRGDDDETYDDTLAARAPGGHATLP
jgi:hypothetical protein